MKPESWTAIASVVNAVTVVVLAAVTYWYARSAKRQAAASEAQALAANAQAIASQQQASAAQQQATAAYQSLLALRHQLDDAAEIGRAMVETRIVSTLRRIDEWESPGRLETMATEGRLPSNFTLVPADETYLIESARRISRDFAIRLANAFDHLRSADDAVNGMQVAAERNRGRTDIYRRESEKASQFIASAKAELQRCRTDIYTVSPQA